MNSKLVKQILESMNVKNACENYKKAVSTISDVIIHPKKYTDNKVAVIPLEAGGGKSSITNISLAWLAKNDLPSAGTIVLKERIEGCDEAVRQIDEFCGKEVAAPYYARLFMQNGVYSHRYENEYRKGLLKYPILVMTHQGFVRRHQRLGDFVQWTDKEYVHNLSMANKVLFRTRLIVDEHPSTLKLTRITDDSMVAIEKYAQGMSNREMFEPIFDICAYIRSKCFVKPADLKTQYWHRCSLNITDKLDKHFYDMRTTTDEILETYTALKMFCIIGGFINFSDDSQFLNIVVGRHIDIFDEIFNTIILDGTAKINSLYQHKRFTLIELPTIKTYKNTTINICKQLSGSRNELKNHKCIISDALAYIDANKPPNEKGLIITMKAFESEFVVKGLPPNTRIDHFGNITGTNKYLDCKHLYIIGVPFWPDNAYKIAYHTYSEDINMNKNHGTLTVCGVRKMADEDYRRTSASMIAAELVQAINRIKCRRWVDGDTPETSIFMLNRDQEVIDLIKECMPGVKITYDFDFYETLTGEIRMKKPAMSIDVVLSTLSKHKLLFPSAKVMKREIFEAHELTEKLSGKTKSVLWQHPAIQQLVNDKKIRLSNRHVEFLE